VDKGHGVIIVMYIYLFINVNSIFLMQNVPSNGEKFHCVDSVIANKKKMPVATATPTVHNRDTIDFNMLPSSMF
jgi:hypothetical protein